MPKSGTIMSVAVVAQGKCPDWEDARLEFLSFGVYSD
jgi:hypothetical protein